MIDCVYHTHVLHIRRVTKIFTDSTFLYQSMSHVCESHFLLFLKKSYFKKEKKNHRSISYYWTIWQHCWRSRFASLVGSVGSFTFFFYASHHQSPFSLLSEQEDIPLVYMFYVFLSQLKTNKNICTDSFAVLYFFFFFLIFVISAVICFKLYYFYFFLLFWSFLNVIHYKWTPRDEVLSSVG